MNILILGSGGREHALAWKIAASPLVDTVWCAPGNPGMDLIGPCFDVDIEDQSAIQKLVLQLEPDLVVIGPEQPLADGLADLLRARGFDVFGPGKDAARIEASKAYSKELMARHGIPTAAFGRFTALEDAVAFLDTLDAPYVLKADGLAAGKGVVIAQDREEAERELEEMLSGKFGTASEEVVIEAFMEGEEASLFVLTDGSNFICLPAAQDHKRVGEGDTGPNTGGMGAYAPAAVLTPDLTNTAIETIVRPTLEALSGEGAMFQGVLYIGLMLTRDGPKVVEYNCRFGDPECQVLMAGLEDDIVPVLLACATGGMPARHFESLLDATRFQPSACIVMAAEGYPGSYQKGHVIKGIADANARDGVTVFHAGTDTAADGTLVSSGGRVLGVTASADDLKTALARAYEGVDAIDWPTGFCRRDIGWRIT